MSLHYDKLSGETARVRKLARGRPNRKTISQCRKSVERHLHHMDKKHQWYQPVFKQDPNVTYYRVPKGDRK